MEKKMSKLKGHYIICGFGQMGNHVVGEFINTKKQFVVVEKDEKKLEVLPENMKDVLYVVGDASSDDVLIRAGIERSCGLITTFASDKDNLFVVLTARSLNQDLRIVARSIEDESEHKLKRAGADAVVSAHSIGGMRMASEMLRPHVVSFLDVMLRVKNRVYRIEQAIIDSNSKFSNTSLHEANIPQKTGLIVIAIKDIETAQYVYNPRSDFMLKTGDVLIVLGNLDQVAKLREFTRGKV